MRAERKSFDEWVVNGNDEQHADRKREETEPEEDGPRNCGAKLAF